MLGISKELENSTALSVTAVGTFKYMSPERLLGQKYDKSADLWSLGIMLIELWTKVHPFSYCNATPIDLIAELEVFNFDMVVPDDKFPRYMKEMIRSILRYDSHERSDCNRLLRCKWFQQFNFSSLTRPTAVYDFTRIFLNIF